MGHKICSPILRINWKYLYQSAGIPLSGVYRLIGVMFLLLTTLLNISTPCFVKSFSNLKVDLYTAIFLDLAKICSMGYVRRIELCSWSMNFIPRRVFLIGLMISVFANGPEDRGSIPGRVIPKTQKMVLDAALLNTQHYKVRIKGKVDQFRE